MGEFDSCQCGLIINIFIVVNVYDYMLIAYKIMRITKEDNNLVLRVPLTQKSYDAIDTYIGDVPNLIGVITERKNGNSDYTINQLICLGYKDSIQIGMPIIHLCVKEELERTCKELGLDIEETIMCSRCDEPIYGAFTIDNKGKPLCFNCEDKLNN